MKINNIALSEMSDNQLEAAIAAITEERIQRKRKEVSQLVQNFHEAYNALRNAGAYVSYNLNDDAVWLDDWDSFVFEE